MDNKQGLSKELNKCYEKQKIESFDVIVVEYKPLRKELEMRFHNSNTHNKQIFKEIKQLNESKKKQCQDHKHNSTRRNC